MGKKIRLGTRNSKLARWQTDRVSVLLRNAVPDINLEIIPITTKGDAVTNVPLNQVGGSGLFTKEIESALLDNRIDAGVHSMKDMESMLPDGLIIGAVPEREDVRDILVSSKANSLAELPDGAKIFTGSMRRRAQLLNMRKNFQVMDIRGNVETRLHKYKESDADGLIMAGAGFKRLGLEDEIACFIPVEQMLPAVGQGALAIEIREDDEYTRSVLAKINNDLYYIITTAERKFMNALQGGCLVPVAGYGKIENGKLILSGFLSNPDGSKSISDALAGDPENAAVLGETLGKRMLENGGKEILKEIKE